MFRLYLQYVMRSRSFPMADKAQLPTPSPDFVPEPPPEPTDADLQAEVVELTGGCRACGNKTEPQIVQLPVLDLYPLLDAVLSSSGLSQANKQKVYDSADSLSLSLRTRMINGQWPVYLCHVGEEISDSCPILGTL